jgi:SP family general alpha glucoside:H+ symporter-like MFS transporter
MLNPSAWGLAGRSGYVWFGTSLFVFITVYFGLPEMKGRSYRELDVLFHKGVPARKFRETKVDDMEE